MSGVLLHDATWDDLCREIKGRCEACLIVAERTRLSDATQVVTGMDFQGSVPHAIGLAAYADTKLRSRVLDMEPAPDDDDTLDG